MSFFEGKIVRYVLILPAIVSSIRAPSRVVGSNYQASRFGLLACLVILL